MVVLEVNVDDATGETLAHTVAALLERGAHDAWVTPIVMKKGRPAHTVSRLADTALSAQVAEVLASETGSLGVRGATIDRGRPPQTDTVDVAGLPGAREGEPRPGEGGARRRRARRWPVGLPLREVISLAEGGEVRVVRGPGQGWVGEGAG